MASLARAGRIEEALGLYDKAVKLRPSWDEGHWYLGTLYYGLDRYAEARDAFRRVIAAQEKKSAKKPLNNGRVYGTEIARGFDVMNLSGAFDNGSVKLPYFNAQTQQPLAP